MQIATIILAGGQGTRLQPLTTHHAKPAISYGGRYRLIDIPISNSINSGIRQIFVMTQYLPEELHHHIHETYHFDSQNPGFVKILSPRKNPNGEIQCYEGTADAVRKNLSIILENSSADYFLILAGDQLYNIDFQEMVSFAQSKNADLTIASIIVSEKEAYRMGLLKIDSHHLVTDFVEKPKNAEVLQKFELSDSKPSSYLGSMGIYVFKREFLIALLQTDQRHDFGYHLITTAVQKGNTAAYVYKGYWEDIGTVASYYKANLLLIGSEGGLNAYDKKNPIFSRPTFLPGPKIKKTTISQSMICEGCIIEASEITNSVIGFCSHIKQGSVIRDTVMMGNHLCSLQTPDPNYWIGENCLIEKTIIDERVQIGDGARIINKNKYTTFDGDGIFVRDGITIIAAGTKIPDGYEF